MNTIPKLRYNIRFSANFSSDLRDSTGREKEEISKPGGEERKILKIGRKP